MDKKEETRNQQRDLKVDYREAKSNFAKSDDEESKRNLRWLHFAKSKFSFGFHHLGPSKLPNIAEDRRGISIHFEKICGWNIPKSIFKSSHLNSEITVQLSLSMFHLPSGTFFGSTWMGPTISLGDTNRRNSTIIDFDYNDIVYIITRVADPTCFAVVEIVVSKIDTTRNLVLEQYG